jgi:YHS domain-containing protein
MNVDEKTANYKSELNGNTYFFCALGCQKAFDESPEKYIGTHHEQHQKHNMHGCCGH